MSADGGLDVKAVVDQFKASEQILAELREKLRGLVLAEESADRAVSSIESASESLSTSARALDAAAGEMQQARDTTVEALEGAKQFLDGTDFAGMREEIDKLAVEMRASVSESNEVLEAFTSEMRSSVAATHGLFQELRDEVRDAVTGMQSEISGLVENLPKVEEARSELESLKAQIPTRTRKKLGI